MSILYMVSQSQFNITFLSGVVIFPDVLMMTGILVDLQTLYHPSLSVVVGSLSLVGSPTKVLEVTQPFFIRTQS